MLDIDSFTVTNVIVALLFILIVYYLWPSVNPSLAHLPGPWPLPFIGNLIPYLKHGFGEGDMIYMKKYGNVFRMYEGRYPTLVVNDAEMIKQITIKEFSNFTNHRIIPLRGIFKHTLFDSRDDKWRRARVMLTPCFTTGKLKKMLPILNKCIDKCIKCLETRAKEDADLDAKRYCGMYTLDVIASTGFSVELDQTDPNNPFIKNAIELLEGFQTFNVYLLISFFFPFMLPLLELLGCEMLPKKNMQFFTHLMEKVIKDRQTSSNTSDANDLLQPMLNAHNEGHDHETKADIEEHGLHGAKNTNIKLTEEEVLAHSVFFFMAGYETTSGSLAWVLYELSKHPDAQERLLEDITSVLQDNDLDYEAISKMQYLDQVVLESLRMYPQATRTDRYCAKDITIKGYRIPADTLVIIPMYLLSYNPDVWPEPKKFKPERFDPDVKKTRNPLFHLPFGAGPRHCIGMRLALLEIKLAVVKILQVYTIKPAKKETKVKFDFNARAENGIWIKLEKR